MDIQRSHFPTKVVDIIQQIADSHFIAFDFEFSGVAGRRKTPAGVQREQLTLQELYDDVKIAAEKYQILQIGLTIVQEDLKRGCYIARPYNFNLNPVPALRERYLRREWTYHSGAVDFLLRNGFKFDLPLTYGVPYLSRKEEQEARDAMNHEEADKATIANMPIKDDDKPLIDHIHFLILKWQSEPKQGQAEYINIPQEGIQAPVPSSLNRYQVRLTHQVVRTAFPKLKTNGMGTFVQVTNPNDEQQASQAAIQAKSHETAIAKAVGFRFLFEAIVGSDLSAMPKEYFKSCLPGNVDPETNEPTLKKFFDELQDRVKGRRKVLVGHNCFTDLVNLYKCFVGDLPESVEDFRQSVHALFPAIVDTKRLASFEGTWNTSLEEVEAEMSKREAPKIEIPFEFDRYKSQDCYHEAGYDSLQTAKIAIRLSAKLEKQKKIKRWPVPNSTDSRGFGINEEKAQSHITMKSPEATSPNLARSISDALTSPVTAVMKFFKADSVSAITRAVEKPNKSNQPTSESDRFSRIQDNAKSLPASPSTVVGIKDSSPGQPKSDTQLLNRAVSSENIYEVLHDEHADTIDFKPDSLTLSDDEEKQQAPKEKLRVRQAEFEQKVSEMVEKGEMMPRWDGESALWQRFGNRLQVNGTVEEVFNLVPH